MFFKKAKGQVMKVIVTGGAGFIGSHLVDALISRGDDVWVIDNLSTGKKENINPKIRLLTFDIRHPNVKNILNSHYGNFDYVFHLAALPRVQYSIMHPEETNAVNINGTLNVIVIAAMLGAKRLIYSSSSSVYGNQSVLPLKEDMPVNPMSPYALQKFAAEKYCQLLFRGAICLRYFNVYGPRQSDQSSYSSAIGTFMKNKKTGAISTIYGGDQTRDFTWVGDVVRANILAAESPNIGNGEIINIGGGKNYSITQLSKIIGGSYIYEPSRVGEPLDTLADISKAKNLLGWKPAVALEEGIAELKKINGLI